MTKASGTTDRRAHPVLEGEVTGVRDRHFTYRTYFDFMANETRPRRGKTAWRATWRPGAGLPRTETGSGALPRGAVIAALLGERRLRSYRELWDTHLSIQVGSHGSTKPWRAW